MDDTSDFDESVVAVHRYRTTRAILNSDSEDEDEESNKSIEASDVNIDDSFQSSNEVERSTANFDVSNIQRSFSQGDESADSRRGDINNTFISSDDDEDVANSENNELTQPSDSSNHSFSNEESETEDVINSSKEIKDQGEDREKSVNIRLENSLREIETQVMEKHEENDTSIIFSEDEVDFGEANINNSSIPQVIEKSLNVVEVSSDEDLPPEISSSPMFSIQPPNKTNNQQKLQVNAEQYKEQIQKINEIQSDLLRAKNAMRVIKLENLPDKGMSLINKEKSLNTMLQGQKEVLNNMEVIDGNVPMAEAKNKIEIAWNEIEAGVNAVAPRTMGVKGMARFKAEKMMAVETLDELHKSLATCPTETDLMEDPPGLKISLMKHQKRALAWMLWREQQKPSGGILADDMGLGKTLTMISLVIKSIQLEKNEDVDKENLNKYPGGTLVVCPASLLNQWSGEVTKRTKRGLLSVEVYHGPKRETRPKRLAKHDVVITTYAIVLNEAERDGTVFGVRWRRLILDEAHQIRNHKARTSEAVCRLSGKSRWALTGTPVHNKELDMYSLLKFLRCFPFDDLQVWKHWVSDKSTGGQLRLHAVVSSLMLRRTKAELMEKGALQALPQRSWELIAVKLEKDELDVYQKVLIFSRTLFAQFLHQRAAKTQDAVNLKFNGAPPDPNGEYFKMRNRLLKLNRVREVSQHEILVLLLRLRQICCHPALIIKMLHGDEDIGNAEDEDGIEEINLLEQLNKLSLNEDDDNQGGISKENVGLKEASRGYLNPSNSVFAEDRRSSKVRVLINILKEKTAGEDKAIVVSQWTSLLRLIAIQLKDEGISHDSLDGSIPVPKRMAIVDEFNDPKSTVKVLLLSLTAGGVGLNLVGANHLFLLDLHWNPQLENQAQDRIYRMGQTKPIFVYKFMAVDTIEERIKDLQERKLGIADSMLTGSQKVINSKLSLQDLKMLFDFK